MLQRVTYNQLIASIYCTVLRLLLIGCYYWKITPKLKIVTCDDSTRGEEMPGMFDSTRELNWQPCSRSKSKAQIFGNKMDN